MSDLKECVTSTTLLSVLLGVSEIEVVQVFTFIFLYSPFVNEIGTKGAEKVALRSSLIKSQQHKPT